jgi:hypothetical protein
MTHPSVILQSRWGLIDHENSPHLLYYGVRNPPHQREVLLPILTTLAEWAGLLS